MRRAYVVAVLILSMLTWTLLAQAAPPVLPAAAPVSPTELKDLSFTVRVNSATLDWFNQTARPEDIAAFNVRDLTNKPDLPDQVKAGRKLLIIPSVADAEQILPTVAGKIQIVGYNLEHWPQTPPEEQADPVAAVKRFRELADQYNLEVALGPDRRFTTDYGAEMVTFADYYVLQLQRLQADDQALRDFADPLFGSLRAANPNVKIIVQLRTDATPDELMTLIDSLKDNISGVHMLTNAASLDTAQDVVGRLKAGGPVVGPTGTPVDPFGGLDDTGPAGTPVPLPNPQLPAVRILWRSALIAAGLACTGLLLVAGFLFGVLYLLSKRNRRSEPPPPPDTSGRPTRKLPSEEDDVE